MTTTLVIMLLLTIYNNHNNNDDNVSSGSKTNTSKLSKPKENRPVGDAAFPREKDAGHGGAISREPCVHASG